MSPRVFCARSRNRRASLLRLGSGGGSAMNHDDITDLLGAYALDAVEPDEASEIELHLRDCPRCRAEVAEHRETAAFLAHAGADAPADLWDRIAGTIDVPAPVIPMAPAMRSHKIGRAHV